MDKAKVGGGLGVTGDGGSAGITGGGAAIDTID